MSKSAKLVAAVAITLMSLPAAAGSWPNIAPRKAKAVSTLVAAPQLSHDGFLAEPGENVASLEQPRYFLDEPKQRTSAPRMAASPRGTAAKLTGFEFVGGETGWQPAGHKYVWSAGAFAHTEDCDHAIRTVKGPTPADVDAVRRQSPGA